jgi:hypothetical protein
MYFCHLVPFSLLYRHSTTRHLAAANAGDAAADADAATLLASPPPTPHPPLFPPALSTPGASFLFMEDEQRQHLHVKARRARYALVDLLIV